jgi:hypothetical protein
MAATKSSQAVKFGSFSSKLRILEISLEISGEAFAGSLRKSFRWKALSESEIIETTDFVFSPRNTRNKLSFFSFFFVLR